MSGGGDRRAPEWYELLGGGGGGLVDNGGRAESAKGGMGSPRAGKDVGLCNDLGEGCLSCGDDKSANGREEAEDAKGEGKPGALETDVEMDGGKADVGGFAPITSCIDGSDCL